MQYKSTVEAKQLFHDECLAQKKKKKKKSKWITTIQTIGVGQIFYLFVFYADQDCLYRWRSCSAAEREGQKKKTALIEWMWKTAGSKVYVRKNAEV